MGADQPIDHRHRLEQLYAAFNRRDLPSLLAALAPDVTWPNGWQGGTVHGHREVADYWTRQWAEIDPRVSLVAFETESDGRTSVTVHQVVRDSTGAVVVDETVRHVYRFAHDLVTDMEIRR